MKIEATLITRDFTDSGSAAQAMEAEGFDCAISFEGPHDPFLPLMMAARETERIELATGVAIAFARNPMICAQIANDLQAISGGRFILGLGTQIRPHIERRFSQTWSRPAARMHEFVRAIRAIWKCWEDGSRLDFRGEFYTHTLMTPMFNPGPNPHGSPRIFLAGVGPRMVETAGEVADGFIMHPLHTQSFAKEQLVPWLQKGLERSGRKRSDYEISCQTIVVVGDSDEQIEAGRNKARGQISFYGSTPAYKVALDHGGWGDLQPELNRLSKEGKWDEMAQRIDDDMLDAICVSGRPEEVGSRLRARNDFADRTTLTLYNEAGPHARAELIRAIKGN